VTAEVAVHESHDLLVAAAAAGLIAALADAQAARGEASLVLTGGRVAKAIYAAVAASPDRDRVDWSRVELWWGDERFLPPGDPDRNETQAREALLGSLPLDPARVHPMPAEEPEYGSDPELAASRYASELADAKPFDLLLLGVGEDGHVASLFPGKPSLEETRPVSAVLDSPKPPPVRISLTLPTINSARQIWLIAAGSGKAEAVGKALAQAGRAEPEGDAGRLPAARVSGRERTLWLLDGDAAARTPAH
jgi:6-phosphogluconolactonase